MSSNIQVSKDGEPNTNTYNAASFFEPGNYTFTARSAANDMFTSSIRITSGLKTETLNGIRYINTEKNKYSVISDETSHLTLTNLTLGQTGSSVIKKAEVNGYPAFGITGSSLHLFMSLANDKSLVNRDWTVLEDNWGEKDNQLIAGVRIGSIKSGALVIQKSYDGIYWKAVDPDKSDTSLYTTDYFNNYHNSGNVLIYTPDGDDIRRGVYLKISYAYKLEEYTGKNRCLEQYKFYLCNSNLKAVTFKNLSLAKSLELTTTSSDGEVEISEKAETLVSNSLTVTGFRVDRSLNPTVSYSVKRDGFTEAIPENEKFTATGKYEITLTNAVGESSISTIYVDRLSAEETLARYFRNGFITGKRIFDENSKVPVYATGATYTISETPRNFLPLGGKITNLSTGDTTIISHTSSEKTGVISEPGTYHAEFTINTTSAGDLKKIEFNFKITPDVPGPVRNQMSLRNYSKTSITDSYPIYYGLTYSSATAGHITLAFATYEEAYNYAYNFEKGMVEEQSDGSYMYIGSFDVSEKIKYESAWDLTDAMRYFADQAVHIGYFDQSNEFKSLTLRDSVIKKTANLRTLELKKSVTIFGPNQKDMLTDIDGLPIINSKPYRYLTPGRNGDVKQGTTGFMFIRDKYGCDSNSVQIVDCNGKQYNIEFNKYVEDQLAEQNCPSGIVTINEQTVYGDSANYQAVYFAPGENTSTISLSLYKDGDEEQKVFSQRDDGVQIETEAFSVTGLNDSLDKYCLVIITDDKNEDYYTADKLSKVSWTTPGEYVVKVVNRLGSAYSLNVKVIDSDYASISFAGNGTEDIEDILTSYGEKNVKLPSLKRKGYDFIGYEDGTGSLYKEEIPTIAFRGHITLNALWKAKQYELVLKDNNGNTFDPMLVEYGKEYELPVPTYEGFEFDGWYLDDVRLTDNKFSMETEGNVIVVAKFKKVVNEDTNEISTNDELTSTQTHFSITLFIILAAFIMLGLLFLVMKNHKTIRENNMSSTEKSGENRR